jgi:hypothetical protein
MLYLITPGAAHAIHLWWLAPDWRFGGWYVNLQEPIRRTTLGFDYMDQMLDIVVEPDLVALEGRARNRRGARVGAGQRGAGRGHPG